MSTRRCGMLQEEQDGVRVRYRYETDGIDERHLASAAELLAAKGEMEPARLLAAASGLAYNFRGWARGLEEVRGKLLVHPAAAAMISDEVRERMRWALEEAAYADEMYVEDLWIVPAAEPAGWRDRIAARNAGPVNHAAIVPLPARHPREDRLSFRDPGELAVYRALKRAQERRAKDGGQSFSVFPNAAVRLPGRTIEVDFLIVYGRTGVIEVDGASHRRKWANDRSRDSLLEDAGIARIDRLDVADAQRSEELDSFVERHLSRLAAG